MPPSTNPFKQLEHPKRGESREAFLNRRKAFYYSFHKQWSFQQSHTTQNCQACSRKESSRNSHSEVLLQVNLASIVNLFLNKDHLYASARITLAYHHMGDENFHDDASSTTTDSEQSIPPSLIN